MSIVTHLHSESTISQTYKSRVCSNWSPLGPSYIMEAVKPNIHFPLFTHHERDNMPSYRQCLWHIDAQTVCGEVLPTFSDMLAHMGQVHNCKLEENINFCCQQIFQSKMEMLEHFLFHIVSSEGTQMELEGECFIFLNL